MVTPQELKYTKEHEWIKILKNEYIIVGITDFAQSELGDIVYVEVETVGENLAKEDVFGTIEAVKTTSDLFMPISGTILEFNPEIDEEEGDNPDLVNTDPYDKGWIIKIKPSDPSELENLLSFEAYQELIQ